MKRIAIILGLVMALTACNAQKGNDIIITAEVNELPEFGLVVSYLKYVQRGIDFDENKRGKYVIEGEDAVFLRLHNGFTEAIDLYAEKGDRIHVSYDGKSFKNGVEISGDRKKITEYLKEETHSFSLPQKMYELEFPEFMEKVNESLSTQLERFEERKKTLKEESRLFVKLEENSIRYSHSFNLLNYPHMHRIISGSTEQTVPEAYFRELKKWMIEDSDLLALEPYRTFMTEAAWKIASNNQGSVDDYQKLTTQMGYIATQLTNKRLMQQLLGILIDRYMQQNGIDKALDQFYRKHVTDADLLARYNREYDSWMRVEPGEPMIDFRVTDLAGKEYSPEDFKGRPVCYYLWVPFYPSIQEYSFLKELQPLFTGKNIELVSLSIADKDEWEKVVVNQEVQLGQHCFLGHDRDFLKKCHYLSGNMYQFIWVDALTKRCVFIYLMMSAAIQNGIITEPAIFGELVDYSTKIWSDLNVQEGKATVDDPDYYKNRGFIAVVSDQFTSESAPWHLSVFTHPSYAGYPHCDFLAYLKAAMYYSESEFRAKYPIESCPLINERYDIVVNYMKTEYGIDLQGIATGSEN